MVCDDVEAQKSAELNYRRELLNSIEPGSSLPDHEINLKEGFVVKLLQNIRPRFGNVNGTRYVVERMTANFLFLISVSGTHKESVLSLPRMNCAPGTDDFPIPDFRRGQFPIRICFAMTINKAQGQSVTDKLGIDLSNPCFAHSQLYLALSRATHQKDVYTCTTFGHHKTKNVIYSEVLTSPAVSRSSHTVVLPLRGKNCLSLRLSGHQMKNAGCMKATNAVRVLEHDYGKIPSRISCSNVTTIASSLKDLICEETRIDYSVISAFLGLLNDSRILAFDALFVTLLQRALLYNYINHVGDFFSSTYGVTRLQWVIDRFNGCNMFLIPLYNEVSSGRGNHWVWLSCTNPRPQFEYMIHCIIYLSLAM